MNLHCVPEDGVVGGAPGLAFQAVIDRERQVADAAAAQATDVVVAAGVAVEAGGLPAGVDFADQALRRQLLEVPVDGGQADAGQPPPRLAEHPVGRRVVHRGAHDLEHDVPLPRVPLAHC